MFFICYNNRRWFVRKVFEGSHATGWHRYYGGSSVLLKSVNNITKRETTLSVSDTTLAFSTKDNDGVATDYVPINPIDIVNKLYVDNLSEETILFDGSLTKDSPEKYTVNK